jgi:hypothetical protein
LNEYVYDEERDADRLVGIPARVNLTRSHKLKMHLKNDEFEEAELETENRYNMIASSKQVECFYINKFGYLKQMYSLTDDKRVAGNYIDKLVRFILKKNKLNLKLFIIYPFTEKILSASSNRSANKRKIFQQLSVEFVQKENVQPAY